MSLENGVTCKLTNEKPNFKETCPDILFENKFKKKRDDVIVELEKVSRDKNKAYLYLIISGIFGILFIIGNKLYGTFIYGETSTYYWKRRIESIGIGITILIGAYYKFNRFRNKLKTIEMKKSRIDKVLKKYGVK
ncbi:hypothetical protein [Spongiivirga citrea]|uniref:DUF4231 domain-containing protein n=1 Tax=Spongiivirga citrea TaxID=1481457 RepID=A0A6M0CT52_9FLAO|nr:hypothetical protein [Spongiivirga citrea]NER19109.1 hypothetical protein [Spongiivirga citrea]